MSLTTNRIKPAFPPSRLVAGETVLFRDMITDVEPPVELRIVHNAMPILERDPARRFSYRVEFLRDGEPAELAGFDTEAQAYTFAESVLEWNQSDDQSDPRCWSADADAWVWEVGPDGPPTDPQDDAWWAENAPATRDGLNVFRAA